MVIVSLMAIPNPSRKSSGHAVLVVKKLANELREGKI